MFPEKMRSIFPLSILSPIFIALFFRAPLSSAFIPCGPATANLLQFKRTTLGRLSSSTSLFPPVHMLSHPKCSIRNASPSIQRGHALRMSESTNEKTCKLAVGDQVRVLVKTITLAKSAVQAGTSSQSDGCEEMEIFSE